MTSAEMISIFLGEENEIATKLGSARRRIENLSKQQVRTNFSPDSSSLLSPFRVKYRTPRTISQFDELIKRSRVRDLSPSKLSIFPILLATPPGYEALAILD